MTDGVAELPPGTAIDRYEIEVPLGEGGFGSVYRARHSLLGHRVALKLLHPQHAKNAEVLERFFREARAAASIGSPHIVRVTDCGVAPTGQPFLVMELLEGQSLESLMACTRPLPAARALAITVQILEGLAAAHGAGIVHRDLKPGNVFLARGPRGEEDFVKLLDFGISKMGAAAGLPSLTRTGAVLGTPLYMAPEGFRGARDVDHRVDIYSIAAVLFELLSGQVPHSGQSYADLAVQVVSKPATPLQAVAPWVPRELAALVDRGLALDPAARPPTAAAFATALREAAVPLASAGAPPRREPCTERGWAEAAPGSGLPGGAFAPLVSEAASPASAPAPGPTAVLAEPPRGGDAAFAQPTPDGNVALVPPAPARSSALARPSSEAAPLVPAAGPSRAGPSPRARRRWLLPLVVVVCLGLLGGGGVAIWLALRPASLRAPGAPVALAPAPSPPVAVAPVPTAPLPAAPTTLPGQDLVAPLGALVQGLVGAAGEAVGLGPPAPAAPQVLTVHEPRIAGDLDPAAIRQVLDQARPAMERCRPAGPLVIVRAQIRILPGGRISMAAPAPGNPGPADLAQCCADCFRGAVPEGWTPGTNGVVFFDVTLPPAAP